MSAILHLCYPQAKDRIQYYQLDEVFVFPYDMGSRWKNFKQVFTWSGVPEGDGLEWPIREGCHQYSLTVSMFVQILLSFCLTFFPLTSELRWRFLVKHVVRIFSVWRNESQLIILNHSLYHILFLI